MTPSDADRQHLRRFLVSWRDGQARPSIHDVGCLSFDGAYYFCYLPGARTAPAFQPLAGLSDMDRSYGPSPELFPVLAARVMTATRPDFRAYVEALDLPRDASALDILSRSGGVSRGDRLVLTEEPAIEGDGRTSSVFAVRGLRFAMPDPQLREQVLSRLTQHEPLTVREEPDNEVSRRALQVRLPQGALLGWVPDPLADYVRRVVMRGGTLRVQRCNGPDQPPHQRLLVRVDGELPLDAVALVSLGARSRAAAAV